MSGDTKIYYFNRLCCGSLDQGRFHIQPYLGTTSTSDHRLSGVVSFWNRLASLSVGLAGFCWAGEGGGGSQRLP